MSEFRDKSRYPFRFPSCPEDHEPHERANRDDGDCQEFKSPAPFVAEYYQRDRHNDCGRGKRHGVVMACSYEARGIGIRSGMPIGMAWRKAPSAVYLRPNYELYGAVSESVINVLRSYADVIEHVSIDEAFLDVTSKVSTFD